MSKQHEHFTVVKTQNFTTESIVGYLKEKWCSFVDEGAIDAVSPVICKGIPIMMSVQRCDVVYLSHASAFRHSRHFPPWVKPSKCLLCRKKPDHPSHQLGGESISATDQKKFLDQSLSFKPHLNTVLNKLSKSIGVIYRLNQYLPSQTHLTLIYWSYGVLTLV